MPRDLAADKDSFSDLPPLDKEPHTSSPDTLLADEQMPSLYQTSTSFVESRFKRMTDLHPFASLLSQDDLDDCDWLEHAAFDANEAASREKLDYRLTTCGELCTGLFSSAYTTSDGPLSKLIKSRQFPSVDSADSDRKKVLMGHIIATKFAESEVVTDASMAFPEDWRTNYQLGPSTGHNEDGETICLHSLCVHPDLNGRGLGGVLLRAWTQRMRDSGFGKRIALICRERLVKFYESAGFKKIGPSECQYGGGNWVDMVLEFETATMDDEIYP